jgi:hypothetical protein
MAGSSIPADPRRMLKRAIAGILWFFTAWSAWTLVAYALGWPGTLGVLVGVAVAAVVVMDPRRRIWARREVTRISQPEAEPEFA